MAFSHGKNTVIRLAAGSGLPASGTTDISAFCNASSFPRTADVSDLSTYGNNSKVYGGGMKDGTITLGGFYDNGTVGTPRVLLEDQEGTTFTIVRRPEGTGTPKPQQKFNAVLKSYDEENPAEEFITWTAEFQCSGDIDKTAQ